MDFIRRKASNAFSSQQDNKAPAEHDIGHSPPSNQHQQQQQELQQSSIGAEEQHPYAAQPQRAVVGEQQEEAPIQHEPTKGRDRNIDQDSALTNQQDDMVSHRAQGGGSHTPVWANVPMQSNMPAHDVKPTKGKNVVNRARTLSSTHQMMPLLPAAGCFDLDAPGNAPIITGYDHDRRSVTSKVAEDVDASYKSNLHKQQIQPATTATALGRGGVKNASTAAGVAGGAAGGAAAGGIVSKCMEYLRGRESKDASQDWDEPIGPSDHSQDKDTTSPGGQFQQTESGKIQDEDWTNQDDASKLSELGEGGHYTPSGQKASGTPIAAGAAGAAAGAAGGAAIATRDTNWTNQDNATKLNKLGEDGHHTASGQQVMHSPQDDEGLHHRQPFSSSSQQSQDDMASNRAVIDEDVNQHSEGLATSEYYGTQDDSVIDHSQDIDNGKTPSTVYSYTRTDGKSPEDSFYGQAIDQPGASHDIGSGAGIGATALGAGAAGGAAGLGAAHIYNHRNAYDDYQRSQPFDAENDAKRAALDKTDAAYGTTSAIDPNAKAGQTYDSQGAGIYAPSSAANDMTMHEDTGMKSDIQDQQKREALGGYEEQNNRTFGHDQLPPRSAYDQNDPSSTGAWDEENADRPFKASQDDSTYNPFTQDRTASSSKPSNINAGDNPPCRPGEFLFDEPHGNATKATAAGAAGAGIGAAGAAGAAGVASTRNKQDPSSSIKDDQLRQQQPKEFDDLHPASNGFDGVEKHQQQQPDQEKSTDDGMNKQQQHEKQTLSKNMSDQHQQSKEGQQQQQPTWDGKPIDQNQSMASQRESWSAMDAQQPDNMNNVIDDVSNGGLRETSVQQNDGVFEPRSTPRTADPSAKGMGTGAALGAGAGAATGALAGDKSESKQQQQQPTDHQGQPITDRIDQKEQQDISNKLEDQQQQDLSQQQYTDQQNPSDQQGMDQRQPGQQQSISKQQPGDANQQPVDSVDQQQQQPDQQQSGAAKNAGIGAGAGAATAAAASALSGDKQAQQPHQISKDVDNSTYRGRQKDKLSKQNVDQADSSADVKQPQQQMQQGSQAPFSSDQNFKPSHGGPGDKAYGQQTGPTLDFSRQRQSVTDQQQSLSQQDQQKPWEQHDQVPQQQQFKDAAGINTAKYNPKNTMSGGIKQQFNSMNPATGGEKQQFANATGPNKSGIAGGLGAGVAAVAGGAAAAIGAATRRGSKAKSTGKQMQQNIPTTLNGAVGGVNENAVGNMTSREQQEVSQQQESRKASEVPRDTMATEQQSVPASQIIQQGGVIYHEPQGGSSSFAAAPGQKAIFVDQNGKQVLPSQIQSNAVFVDQTGDRIQSSQLNKDAIAQQQQLHQQEASTSGQQQPESHQASTDMSGQPQAQHPHPAEQQPSSGGTAATGAGAGAVTGAATGGVIAGQGYRQQQTGAGNGMPMQQQQQLPQQRQSVPGANNPDNRASFQNYVNGKIEHRRASFKENIGKMFHLENWKQEAREMKEQAQQKIEGYDAVRRRSSAGAAM
ncbi:hypothetical protein BDB00DRAFT_872915 [Zychaea mexicana]|uniref:uncharacterized protein n=1 Tax=Zychaea mexicana TaxID=64656 RepID=UPI0022FEEC23|nr:uncharacterized protein BDB00DRAFT_872915 [Zychaea mexicana]KAI9492867.1 hypothetical protein BDB00DRAFT_872915 [Zychaea mexicana]